MDESAAPAAGPRPQPQIYMVPARAMAALARNAVGDVPVMVEREAAMVGKSVVTGHAFRHDGPAETQIFLIVGRAQVPAAPLHVPGKRHLRKMPVRLRQIGARVISRTNDPRGGMHPLVRGLSRSVQAIFALKERIRAHKGLVVKIRAGVVHGRGGKFFRGGRRIEARHGAAHPGPMIRQVMRFVAGCARFVPDIRGFRRLPRFGVVPGRLLPGDASRKHRKQGQGQDQGQNTRGANTGWPKGRPVHTLLAIFWT